MACGAALAFEDALVLADLISRHDTASAVVQEFVRRRAPRVGWVRRQTNDRDRLRALPAIIRDPFLRMRANRMYQKNYEPLLAPP
jgi:2-polyprenyl-6-methoxyphenol hydroxylase-like FAD-dependent oxidoreductase